jgi:hypothetical protein
MATALAERTVTAFVNDLQQQKHMTSNPNRISGMNSNSMSLANNNKKHTVLPRPDHYIDKK